MLDHFTPSEYMKLLEMKSTGVERDDKEPIRQGYDLKYKHITYHCRSSGSGIKISETFLCASMPGTVRMDCVPGRERSTVFSVFPLTKQNDSLYS